MNCWFLNLEIILEILETQPLLYTTRDFVRRIRDTSVAKRDENVLATPTENLLYLYCHTYYVKVRQSVLFENLFTYLLNVVSNQFFT